MPTLTRQRNPVWLILSLAAFSLSHVATLPLCHAQVPKLIRYQGQAVDAKGVPLEGPYTLTFRLYDADTAGTKLWEEIQPNVPLTHGAFSVLLGSVSLLTTMSWDKPCWLSVQVNAEPELSPRQQITSVPLAIRAETAEIVKTSGISDDASRLVPSGAIILWDGVSCPAGYTRLSTYDDRFLLASATAGTTGGSNTHDHGGSTGSHTLTIDEMPRHRHIVSSGGGGSVDMDSVLDSANPDEGFTGHDFTDYTGGNAGHTHPTMPADNRPQFKTILLCKKD